MLPSDWKNEIQNSIDQATLHSDEAAKRREEERSVATAGALHALSGKIDAYVDKQESAERGKRRRECITIAVLLFTLIVLYFQWRTFEATDHTLKDTLASSKFEQRAWIKVEPEISGKFEFSDVGFSVLPLHLFLTNVGKSPAFRVTTYVQGHLLSAKSQNIFEAQKLDCDKLKIRPTAGSGIFLDTMVLFPGERLVGGERMGASLTSVVFTPEVIAENTTDGIIQPWVHGCVDYAFGSPQERHQTGFIYRVGFLTERPGMLSALSFGVTPKGSVSSNKIKLFPVPVADGQTN